MFIETIEDDLLCLLLAMMVMIVEIILILIIILEKIGTNLKNYDDNDCYTIGAIHAINDESDYLEGDANDMQNHKLGDDVFDESDMFENVFATNNGYLSLGVLCLIKMIFLVSPTFDEQIYYDDYMPPIYDDCNKDESGFEGVSTLDINYPTIFRVLNLILMIKMDLEMA